MINKDVVELLNDQINMELFSAYFYYDIANYFAEIGLDGFAHWFYVQVREEESHAELIRKFLQNNDYTVKLKAIEDPSKEYSDNMAVLEDFLAHEKEITASIDNIYEKALEVKDFRSANFLNWFIAEQDEEETNALDLIALYELHGDNNLFNLDNKLSGREFHEPDLEL